MNPTSRAYFSLATLYEMQGKYEDAIASYKQAAEIDPQRWDAHERAAVLLQKRGMIPEAVEHFRKVVAFHPGAIEARENLAAGLVSQGEIGESVQQFQKLLDLAPERMRHGSSSARSWLWPAVLTRRRLHWPRP